MKMKKLARVFTSAVLVSAMVATMGGMTAFAASVSSIPLTKNVTTDGNTYAPNVTFNFILEPGSAGTLGSLEAPLAKNETEGLEVPEASIGAVVYAGPEQGLELAANSLSFGTTIEGMTGLASTYTNATQINVNVSEFSAPGIYHYTVRESVPEEADKYIGIDYDDKVRDIYVYVMSDAAGNLEVNNIIVAVDGVKQSGTTSEQYDNGVVFTNNYGAGSNDTDVNELTVTKVVDGNQGDRKRVFEFYFSVTKEGESDRKYKMVKYTGENIENGKEEEVEAGQPKCIELKDNESFRIYGLTKADEYKVGEVDYTADGYTTNYTLNSVDTALDSKIVLKDGYQLDAKSGFIEAASGTIVVTNTKEVTTPTGIVLSFAPYILLVALAGVFGVLFLRRRKEEF